jgi:branched-chain amino acid transport system ATP-binding protein
LLEVKHATIHYSKALAVEDVSLRVGAGEVVSIIGANGAGKSTILRAISGLKSLSGGEIWFEGRRIDGLETMAIVKRGIVHIPEGRRLFPYLTVLDNLKLGASLRKDKSGVERDLEDILVQFPRLKERTHQEAGTLSGGEQQMLAIGRGLMADPRILMLDEPSVGLSPIMVEKVADIIKQINQKGVTVLLVEQNVSLAFGVSSQGYALQAGRLVFSGTMEELKAGDAVKQAYFGG